MDKTAIKNFAIWARNELIKKVSQKAAEYGVRDKEIKDINDTSIDGKLLSSNELRQRQILIEKIEKQGFDNVIEEVAYTWFNRFIALRFMEVNGYLPSMIKVFTDENNDFNPEILSQAVYLDFQGLNKEKIFELKEKNEDEELFKYLLIAQCNDLNSILPGMFQKISDYTELLFPDNLLRDDSVISKMVKDIPEEDWKDQVQIIGWLYQYYNTDLNKKINKEKKQIKITKERIPAATQFFTPDWIVKYMVENTLGKLWLEGHPNEELKKEWKYYLEESEQEVEVKKEIDKIFAYYSNLSPQDITCIDPAMGSGHILVYMFDVLMQIYISYGYTSRDAVESIIANNLYGLDIDIRAYQLSYFSIMMKAREYDRRFLTRGEIPQPNLFYIKSSYCLDINCDFIKYFGAEDTSIKNDLVKIIKDMEFANEYGSIIKVDTLKTSEIKSKILNLNKQKVFNVFEKELKSLTEILKIIDVLQKKYHVTVTNPPYLSSKDVSKRLKKYIADYYPMSKMDLFSVFIELCFNLTRHSGLIGMITMQSWMFLSSFSELRRKMLEKDLISMLHLGTNAFEDISGEIVSTTSFIYRCTNIKDFMSIFYRLSNQKNKVNKEKLFFETKLKGIDSNIVYKKNARTFNNIPNNPFSYYSNNQILENFKNTNIGDILFPRQGLACGDVKKYKRLWFEVDVNKIGIGYDSVESFHKSKKKYVFINDGGKFRKWYGNNLNIIKFDKTNYFEMLEIGNKLPSRKFYFQKGITWTAITSKNLSVRYFDKGTVFSNAGMAIFGQENLLFIVLGVLNSKIGSKFLESLNESLNYNKGDISNVPLPYRENISNLDKFIELVKHCILITKLDYDMFETSINFKKLKILTGLSIKDAFYCVKKDIDERYYHIKGLENQIYDMLIEWYGLSTMKSIEEPEEVTIYKIVEEVKSKNNNNTYLLDKKSIVNQIMSFFVGCLLGRYSLDEEGLIFAGGKFEADRYKTYPSDKDGIIPITELEYFSNDILSKFIQFIETVYSKETLEGNLDFIAEALGGKGTSRDIIRNYFIKDFYKNHVKTYQKRPIYWMFDSGNKNAFKALIYMHRYEKDTIAKLRTDYIHPTQDLYRSMIEDLEMRKNTATSSEKIKIEKELKDLKDKETELREYEEKIHHLADQMIEIDLDDGVEHNYTLFKAVLAKK